MFRSVTQGIAEIRAEVRRLAELAAYAIWSVIALVGAWIAWVVRKFWK